ASANDLAAAAARVVPELVPFRRAVMRLLGRPVGLTGSGPTLWVLYPSLAEADAAADALKRALEEGRLGAAGNGPPFVTATTIASGPEAQEHHEQAPEQAPDEAALAGGGQPGRSDG